MAGGGQDGSGAGLFEQVDADALGVDRDADRPDPGARDELPFAGVPRVLHGQGPVAPVAEDAAEQGESLGEARGDHEVLGAGAHPADPAEVARQDVTGQRNPGGRGVAELAVAGGAQCDGDAADPLLAREGEQVGGAGPQVPGGLSAVAVRRGGDGGGGRGGEGGGHRGQAAAVLGDRGARAAPGHQVALGGELFVRLHHHTARDAQVGGELAAGG